MEIPKINTDFLYKKSPIDYDAMNKALEDLGPNVHSEQLEEIKKLRELLENKSYSERHPIKWNLFLLAIGALLAELIRLLIDIAKG